MGYTISYLKPLGHLEIFGSNGSIFGSFHVIETMFMVSTQVGTTLGVELVLL